MSKLVEQVKAYAAEHYTDGGWDVIVEAWDDAQIAEQIKGARSIASALKKMNDVVSVFADRQADAVVSSGEPEAAAKPAPRATPRKRASKPAEKPATAVKQAPASKPAPKRAKAAQPAAEAPKTTKSDGRALATLSSEQGDVPADAAELRKLIKITRDRRWRAGRRDDAELVDRMNAQLAIFTEKLAAMTPAAATATPEPAATSNVIELTPARPRKARAK